MKILLDQNKPFFKANLHCHSTQSDGIHTVEELKRAYMAQGYSVIAFSDHEHLIDNSRLTDENFLAITACELAIKEFPLQSTLKNQAMRVCHLNLYALDAHNDLTPCYSVVADHYLNDDIKRLIRTDGDYPREYSAKGINEIVRIAKERGFLVSYNHPTWSLENAVDYLAYENLFSVEIYNHSCVRAGRCDDEHVLDDMLRDGKRIFCTAADDNHGADDRFGGWVQINAERLEYGTIMNALQAGNFYASTGPQIFSLTLDQDEVEIRTSPCAKISLSTFGRRAQAVYAKQGETLCVARFKVLKADKYFRLRVTDERGESAYTQAYFLDEQKNVN